MPDSRRPAMPGGALPPAVAAALRPELQSLSDEIVAAIGREVEAYRRPLEGAFGRAVRVGTERALARFVELIADAGRDDDAGARTYVDLGRGEFRQGRSLDALLAAYRLGARLAWRRFAQAGDAAGLPPQVMYRLGEAVFAYIDGLSAESAAGYAEAQSEAAGERQRRRSEVVAMLRRQPAPEEAVVARAAHQAGWRLPARLAALVTGREEADAQDAGRLAGRLGVDAIAVALDEVVLALVPDADAPGHRARLERALAGRTAAVGPTVAWAEAPRSVDRALATWGLAREGVVPGGRLLAAEEHLLELLVHRDPDLAAELRSRSLAGLRALPPRSREKLTRTLRAWLDHRGRVEEVARSLDVHPQTVRYRVNGLRDALGAALDDPDRRLELSLALRAAEPEPDV